MLNSSTGQRHREKRKKPTLALLTTRSIDYVVDCGILVGNIFYGKRIDLFKCLY